MCRDCNEIGPDQFDLKAELTGGLDGVAMKQGPVSSGDRRNLGDRLNNAGLIICIHDRNQSRAPIGGKEPVERV